VKEKIIKYVHEIYKLQTIIRYNNSLRIKDENVAEHSFYVTAITLELHKYYDFNLEKALQMAIKHDLPEIYIQDICHNTKRMFPELKKTLKMCELKVARSFNDNTAHLITELENGDSVESKIVEMADVLSCIQYSKNEMLLGNKDYMLVVHDESIKRFKELIKKLKRYKR
jgi:5'-deoxynucleotidase YfbR-like HD superfamily hydrolase